MEPWNLKPDEWAHVLSKETNPLKMAEDVRKGRVLPWAKTLLEETSDAQNTLDLGSGCGQNSAALALQNKTTTLLDWSNENIAFSKELYKALGMQGTFLQGDMTKRLPFADRSFDAVFTCGVLEYFSDAQINTIFAEMLRVARKRVIVMVPNARSIPYQTGMWYMKKTNRWEWGGERPFATMKPYFKHNGITTVREWTVSTWHSLNFLTMPGGLFLQKAVRKLFKITEHPRPARFGQGYLLISIAEKA